MCVINKFHLTCLTLHYTQHGPRANHLFFHPTRIVFATFSYKHVSFRQTCIHLNTPTHTHHREERKRTEREKTASSYSRYLFDDWLLPCLTVLQCALIVKS